MNRGAFPYVQVTLAALNPETSVARAGGCGIGTLVRPALAPALALPFAFAFALISRVPSFLLYNSSKTFLTAAEQSTVVILLIALEHA